LFESNKEELEILNSLQNFIFINKGAARAQVPSLATPLSANMHVASTCFNAIYCRSQPCF